MSMAVLDFDVEALPSSLEGMCDYSHALVLLRVQNRPAGQALVPLRGGRCLDFRFRAFEAADSAFWEAWLRARLGLEPAVRDPAVWPRSTVAICTRDRTEDLERCLAAILAMHDDGQALLVIDNAPRTEDTRGLVSSYDRVRYVREDRPGLDVARNRALREATTEIVAFTDDDAVPDRDWLRCLVRNFNDPLVMAATGATMPLELETEAQIAFQQYGGFLRGFKRLVYDAALNDPLLGWHAGAGVNMAMRRSILAAVGSFDEALDAGTPTQAGGDSDMFRRILSAGYRIVYDPEALNWHRHRREDAELIRQLAGYETAELAVLTKALVYERDCGSLWHMAKWAARESFGLLRAALRRPHAAPLKLAASRVGGGLAGPFAYRKARRAS